MPDLIGRAGWNDALVRADVRTLVAARLGRPDGILLVDVALCLPKSRTDDPERRAEAGAPGTLGFATEPQLARRLIEAAVTGGLPCRWVTGDKPTAATRTWPRRHADAAR
ncbi:transposase [Actinoplanes sp. NPDC048796]|uniref:transposase n=1 Tax=Actinoplanes sp. NPDC048796 TaxID=3155640 RepID=UPI0033E7420D